MTDTTLADALTNGLDSLSDLAQQEYPNLDLNQLVKQAAQHDEMSLQRLSRLIGVALKQPFAKKLF